MEIFNFCLEIVKREGERFNTTIDSSTISKISYTKANNINYDIFCNRCSYLYCCGAINITFAMECLNNFIMMYHDLTLLFSKWNDSSNLTFCSIGNGPALDYVAFLLSLHQYIDKGPFPLFKNIFIISKNDAWRNTVNILQQVVSEGLLKPFSGTTLGNIEVIQGDPLQKFSKKVKIPICDSDVIMMIKCNKPKVLDDKVNFATALTDLFDALKPGATVFCIDAKPIVTVIEEVLSKFHGKFIFKSTHMSTSFDFDISDIYKMKFGCSPVKSARGSFFVWQKSSVISTSMFVEDKVANIIKPLPFGFGTIEDWKEKFLPKRVSSSNTQIPHPSISLKNKCPEYGNKMVNNYRMDQLQFGSSGFGIADCKNDFSSNSSTHISQPSILLENEFPEYKTVSQDKSTHDYVSSVFQGSNNIHKAARNGIQPTIPETHEIFYSDPIVESFETACNYGDTLTDTNFSNVSLISTFSDRKNNDLYLIENVNTCSQNLPSTAPLVDKISHSYLNSEHSTETENDCMHTHVNTNLPNVYPITAVLDSRNNNMHSVENVNNMQLSSTTSKSIEPAFDTTVKNSLKTVYMDISNQDFKKFDESLHSETKHHSDENVAFNITALTDKVAKLTQAINNMLETTKHHPYVPKQREKFDSAVVCHFCSNSSIQDYLHCSPCLTEPCTSMCHRTYIGDSNQPLTFFPHNNSYCDSLYKSRYLAIRCNSCKWHVESNVSRNRLCQNETPNIIIPLNSLTREVVSQIVCPFSSKIKKD